MPTRNVNGQDVELTPGELAQLRFFRNEQVEALRDRLHDRVRDAANQRIAQLHQRLRPDVDLAFDQIHVFASLLWLLDKDRRAMANQIAILRALPAQPYPGAGALTAGERDYLDQQFSRFQSVVAIRQTEGAAHAAIDAAARDAAATPEARRTELLALADAVVWP